MNALLLSNSSIAPGEIFAYQQSLSRLFMSFAKQLIQWTTNKTTRKAFAHPTPLQPTQQQQQQQPQHTTL